MIRVGTVVVADTKDARMASLGETAANAKPGEYAAFIPAWGAKSLNLGREAESEFHVVVDVSVAGAMAAGIVAWESGVVIVDGTVQKA